MGLVSLASKDENEVESCTAYNVSSMFKFKVYSMLYFLHLHSRSYGEWELSIIGFEEKERKYLYEQTRLGSWENGKRLI